MESNFLASKQPFSASVFGFGSQCICECYVFSVGERCGVDVTVNGRKANIFALSNNSDIIAPWRASLMLEKMKIIDVTIVENALRASFRIKDEKDEVSARRMISLIGDDYRQIMQREIPEDIISKNLLGPGDDFRPDIFPLYSEYLQNTMPYHSNFDRFKDQSNSFGSIDDSLVASRDFNLMLVELNDFDDNHDAEATRKAILYLCTSGLNRRKRKHMTFSTAVLLGAAYHDWILGASNVPQLDAQSANKAIDMLARWLAAGSWKNYVRQFRELSYETARKKLEAILEEISTPNGTLSEEE